MYAVKIADKGQVALPPEICRALGLQEGDKVAWNYANGQVHLCTRRSQLEHARKLFQKACPQENTASLSDELIRDRRQEALDE